MNRHLKSITNDQATKRTFGVVLLFFQLIFSFFIVSPAFAEVCCKCISADKPDKNICLTVNADDSTSPAACAGIPGNGNQATRSLTCTLLPANQCKRISEGMCHEGPAVAANYTGNGSAAGTSNDGTEIGEAYAPNVAIPGLYYSAPTVSGVYINVPFLAEYIQAVYNYAIGIAIIATAVMIVYGGFRYILGSALSDVTRGKEIIKDALIGLVLVLGMHTILSTINPATTELQSLSLLNVNRDMLDENEQMVTQSSSEHPEALNTRPTPITAPSHTTTPSPPGGSPDLPEGAPPMTPYPNFTLPPTPGSLGWIHNGNCDFEINQAGQPTALSMYRCAFEVVAKEMGIDPCYMMGPLTREAKMIIPGIVGHDEEGDPKQIKRFSQRGKSYLATQGRGGFTWTPGTYKGPNDDHVLNYSLDDLDLDPDYSHDVGFGTTIAPANCPIPSKKLRLQPYYALLGAAQWIRCALDGKTNYSSYWKFPPLYNDQTYNYAIYNVFKDWGGGAKKTDYFSITDKNRSFMHLQGTHAYYVGQCRILGNPYLAILKDFSNWKDQNPTNKFWMKKTANAVSHFSVCRGDLPLDKNECIAYVNTYLKDLHVDPIECTKQTCFYDPNRPEGNFPIRQKAMGGKNILVPVDHFCLYDTQCGSDEECKAKVEWAAGVCVKK
ncbi:MAG: pilin [Patescibacteria group bacterium]